MPFLGNDGTTELFLIVLALIILFGGSTIHKWAKGIGKAGKEVRLVKKEIEEGFEGEIADETLLEEADESIRKSKKAKKKHSKAAHTEGGGN